MTREEILIRDLPLDGPGLEIAPLFRPTLERNRYDIYYCDCCPAEESRKKHKGYDHEDIVDIDFIWTPGTRLCDAAPKGIKFNYVIASHVIEHVPDPVGFILDIFEAMRGGGILSLAVPDKRKCYDYFRRETDVAQLVHNFMNKITIPSTEQIFDFLTNNIDTSYNQPWLTGEKFEECKRCYTDEQALSFCRHVLLTGQYLDVHCSVFTPDGFFKNFSKIIELGIISNAKIHEPYSGDGEFFCKIEKTA